MKPILYVGAVLMVGASVYGFVDYKKASQKNEFSEMYESTEKSNEVLPAKETSITKEPVTEMKTEASKKISVLPVKKTLEEETLTEELNESVFFEEILPVEKIESEKALVKEPELKGDTEIKNVSSSKKKKKLNHKLFSRAPLEEKYLEKDIKIEDLKLEPLKVEKKKQ
jgi:hypothetical protein